MAETWNSKLIYSPPPEKVVAIINPNSGMGRGWRVLELLKQRPHNAELLTIFKTHPDRLTGHQEAIEYAQRVQADRIIVSGGDGTLMETLTAMYRQGCSFPVAVVPTGTGNIVANDLAMPRRILLAVENAFSAGWLRRWDAGLLVKEQMVFALRASAGFEANVLQTMNHAAKKRWGIIAYMLPAWQEFIRAESRIFTVQIDEQPAFQQKGVVAFVAVTSRIVSAVDFVISRRIRPDDGVLYMGIFHPHKLLYNLPALVNQAALQAHDMISVYPVRHRVTIDADKPQVTQVDGELLGTTPLEIETLPGYIQFVTPLTPRGRHLRPQRNVALIKT